MLPILLTRIKTRDGVTLSGLVVQPQRKKDTALILVHGLGSKFYTGQLLIHALSSVFNKEGVGFLKFNTRGHDIAAREEKGFVGAAFEKFTDCILDVRAMIAFARKLGYRKIILAGHSTGANKTLYYIYKTRDRNVKGLLLLGPVSDIAALPYTGPFDPVKHSKAALHIAKQLKTKKPFTLLPQEYGIWTAQRFWSLYHPGEAEDVFPYYNPKAKWKELNSIRVPVAVIFGSRDEYRDRPIKKILAAFRTHATSTKSFSGVIIQGANHGFQKKEKELARAITKWIKQNGL